MESQVAQLISHQTNPDNYVRTRAEQEFDQLVRADPSQALCTLVVVGTSPHLDLVVRQGALLHVKRLVPKFWSPAFDSYEGPSTIAPSAKQYVRDGLLRLVGDADSKIRNSASYAITQISAVDYPDEWPTLLGDLYAIATDKASTAYQVLGSLAVLQDLFDDLIPDEQFFEGGVSERILQTCEMILTSDAYNFQIKAQTLKLLRTVVDIFNSAEVSDHPARKQFVDQVVPRLVDLFAAMAAQVVGNEALLRSLVIVGLKNELYGCLSALANTFPKLVAPHAPRLLDTTVRELATTAAVYVPLLGAEDIEAATNAQFSDLGEFQSVHIERIDSSELLASAVAGTIAFLQALCDLPGTFLPEAMVRELCALLVQFNVLPREAQAGYEADFNEFVSVETELTIETGTVVRDATRDLLETANTELNGAMVAELVQQLTAQVRADAADATVESTAYLLMCLFSNEAELQPSFEPEKLLKFLLQLILEQFHRAQLLAARLIMLVPKFLMKYEPYLKEYAVPTLEQILDLPLDADHELVDAAVLIAFQYFNHFIPSSQFSTGIQTRLLQLVKQLMDSATEDTNIMLLEALTIIINIDNRALATDEATLVLCMNLGFRDCSNFSLTSSTLECVEDLLKGIPEESYVGLCYKALPPLLKVVGDSNGEYSPELDLALQVLAVFLKGPAGQNEGGQGAVGALPEDVFQAVFPSICSLILKCDDDEVLQSSSEVFNVLLSKGSPQIRAYRDAASGATGNELLLKIVSKFLSPAMSDRAIVRLGDLIVLLIENFSTESSVWQHFQEILQAATLRLLAAKEMITIENLVLIFNTLTVLQPQQTVDFLAGFAVDGQSALEKVLPVWLQAFEVMRGYDRILSNIRAFIEIYKLDDARLKRTLVNGDVLPNQVPDDVIVTRSMARKMPIRYEQVGADVKIVRLLLNEYKFQVRSAQKTEQAQNAQPADDDDDGWEDLDDVGVPSFEQLQQYVHEDEHTGRTPADNNGDEIRQLLAAFFKECTAKNLGGFQDVYARLGDEDKRFLTEYVAFT
ncbi:hypothetical protein KL929_003962 [Ogataea haglerorum]|nr:hypothetical protein KL929_003962 [Ogataea haglerorum]